MAKKKAAEKKAEQEDGKELAEVAVIEKVRTPEVPHDPVVRKALGLDA